MRTNLYIALRVGLLAGGFACRGAPVFDPRNPSSATMDPGRRRGRYHPNTGSSVFWLGVTAWQRLLGNVRSSIHVDRGLIDCARYIRNRPPVDAVVQDSQLDKFLILAGLDERPSFAARVDEWTRQSKVFRESAYQEQLGKLQRLQQANNIPDLQRLVRETGIRWYVTHPDDPNVWPSEFRDQPAFESSGYRVYDLQRCFDLRG